EPRTDPHRARPTRRGRTPLSDAGRDGTTPPGRSGGRLLDRRPPRTPYGGREGLARGSRRFDRRFDRVGKVIRFPFRRRHGARVGSRFIPRVAHLWVWTTARYSATASAWSRPNSG